MAQWPRQDIPLYKKRDSEGNLVPSFAKLHLDYAEDLLKNSNNSRERMTRLYNSYNGVKTPGSLAWLERNYGKQNKSKYIAYRLGRTKIGLLHGEWLRRPLTATVETINSEAVSSKMQQVDVMTGAMIAKKELTDLKEIVGVDVMEGAPIPNGPEDPIWNKMSFKDKQEDVMQIILDEQVKTLDLKRKIGECFKDLLITSMCYCKVEIDENGEVQFHYIDPRDAIYEKIQGDDYLQKSPIKGCRQSLSVHEILMRYNLTDEQRNKLNAARQNPSLYTGSQGYSRGYMRMSGGELMCDVIHIEWLSVEPVYQKISPKTKAQMEIDSTTDSVVLDIDARSYEENIDVHKKNIESGKYQITTKYKQVVYEATRIGGCIDVNMREKPFQKRDIADNPSYILDTSYHGYICGTTDGVEISMQQIIENFDNLYDIIQYQKNRDLARAKGKALFYDRAGLPEGRKMKDVMYQILNDGYIDYNSAAAGNFAQRNLSDLTNAIKEVDLGLSQSFEYLLAAEQNVINQLDKITGINENRQGDIAASATVTNANSAIQASRTITEPMFLGMNGFVQIVMQSIVNSSAISWAFYKTEKGEYILGTDKFKFLQVTKELGFRTYGVHIEDGGKYLDIKQRMNALAEFSLNAKEIRPVDVLKLQLAETTAQMKTTLENSWAEVQEAVQKSNEANNAARQQMEQMRQQTQYQIAKENREDSQTNEKDNIVLDGKVQIAVDNNKAKNKMYEDQSKAENDFLTK